MPVSVEPQEFVVRSYETDPSGRLTLPWLCSYMQESAWHNAERMGAGVGLLSAQGLAWVLQRLRIEVRRYPRHGDRLSVATWARRFDRVIALRDFDLRGGDRGSLAVATSRWVVVDLKARRVVRLPDFIRRLSLPERPPALEIDDGVLPEVVRADIERRYEVRRSDLDAARHVNNTRYVDWALETVPAEVLEELRPARFEIVFRRESVYGDAVLSRVQRLGDEAFAHSLRRLGDGEELARAVSHWRPLVD